MDKFFSKDSCDRCGESLNVRTMSWFNDETICMRCASSEDILKTFLPDGGSEFEGCGYLPEMCEHCNGYGSSFKDKEEDTKCTKCGGKGILMQGNPV